MGIDKKVYGALNKEIVGLASGFDHAVRTGDNTFSIFFIDGSKVDLFIPLPADGKDGVSVKTLVPVDENTFKFEFTDGTFSDPFDFPSGSLEKELTATVEIGSVTNGKKYAAGVTFETILRDILIKEEAPGVVLTLSPAKVLYDVVNETLSNLSIIAAVTEKTYPPTKVTYSINGSVVKETDITESGNYRYDHTFNTPVNTEQVIKVTVTDGKLSSSATKSIKFVPQSYYGTVASDIGTPTEAQIKSLNKTLKDTKACTYDNIVVDFGKVVYAYPKKFGELTSIKDPVNNLNYTESFSKTTVEVDGIEYLVYTQTDPSAADGVKLVFA